MSIERVTIPLLVIAATLLERPTAEHHGYAIARETGLAGGTVQQNLSRLEAEGWLTSHREDIDPREAGRRPRRLYMLTATGVSSAERLIRDHAHRAQGAAAVGRLAPRLRFTDLIEWVREWLGDLPRTAEEAT